MAQRKSGDKSLVEKMREMEINPIFPIIALVVVVLGIGYFAWLRPKMADDKTLRDFNTAEAQAKRDPDQRKVSTAMQAKIAELRAKEQHLDTGNARRQR